MRRFFCLLLLICLPLQSFPLQGKQLLSADIAHELQHDQGVQHHHGDDGEIHYDSSDESAQHAVDSAGTSGSAWSPAPHLAPMPAAPLRLLVLVEPGQWVPDPQLDSPDKPPAPSLG